LTDPKTMVREFWQLCTWVSAAYDLYQSMFDTDEHTLQLFESIAPLFFGDLNNILIENLILQFTKITDPAKTGKNPNLTSNYVLEEISWPDDVRQNLQEVNQRLIAFRQYIEPARSKRVAHIDLHAHIERWETLGAFPKGADRQFLLDLQQFVDIAYGHFNNGESMPIAVAVSTDTYKLVRALEEAIIFNRCGKCTAGERAAAVLDYEAHGA
jgi:AbiU2